MDSFSFHLTAQQLAQLHMKLSKTNRASSPTHPFESISAVIWRAIVKVRDGPEPNTVTVIKQGPKADDMTLRNNQKVFSIKANFSVAKAHLNELVELIHDRAQNETAQIAEMVGQDPSGSDFITYGSNPTFVDWGEAEFYGFEFKGLGPKLVNCFIDGVGQEGVVLVLPGPKNVKKGDEGRLVTLILPKSYVGDLKEELKKDWHLIA